MPSVILRVLFAALLTLAPVAAYADNAPDTPVVTGPNFGQVPIGQTLVTPAGGTQQPLATILGNTGGNVTGPGSAAVNNIAVFNATTGKQIKDAGSVTASANSLNALGLTPLQTVGTALISVNSLTPNNQSIAVGAGAAPNMSSVADFDVFLGAGAGQNYVGTTAQEHVMLGGGAGANLDAVSSVHDVGVGVYAMHYETTGQSNACIGGDCMRNTVGALGFSGVGNRVGQSYYGVNSSAVGLQTLYGNSQSLLIGGTPTTGDTIPLIFTASNIAGSPYTFTYTVRNTDTTTAILAQSMAAAISADTTLLQADWRGFSEITATPNVLAITGPGNNTVGPNPLTVTVGTIGGSATETVAVTGGVSSTAQYNTGVGYEALLGTRITTARDNIALGRFALANVTTATNNVVAGDLGCQFCQAPSAVVSIGYNTLSNASAVSPFTAVVVGANAGGGVTSGNTFTLLGANAGASTLTTASHVIIITDGSTCDSNTVNHIMVCGGGGTIWAATGINSASASVSYMAGGLVLGSTTTLSGGTASTGTLTMAKETSSGTAPSAGFAKLEVVAGTSGGTCKLQMYAGTSTTPTTVLDNVGAGC